MQDVFSAHRQEGSTVLDSKKTALIVVDMINEFCKPGGKMVLPGYEKLMPQQKALIAAARANDVPVIFVIDSHRKNMRQDREFLKRTPHGVENTWATEIIEDLEPREDDLYVIKHRYSAFFQTDMDLLLKDMQISQVVVCGVVTNICVRSTVHDAFFQGYDVVVPHDACAATGPREHVSTLYDIATHFGTVAETDTVIEGLSSGKTILNQVFEEDMAPGMAAQ
ncbi:cysteine hydrolase family protein [Oricola indica]|jgi:ureidoacrylate peracid hydrolase|uniref:cysteine hydrolase family protein n=1 Tax=Oricola indica TaxID=2872591 RepID=UPI001CBF2933|nr:isochorismatase family cysteine hydrolase [Oricola indica]